MPRIDKSGTLRGKVYASDEGFGPLVRDSAILHALRRRHPATAFTVQTERHADKIPGLIDDVTIVRKFNNIAWAKQADGSPALPKIKLFFQDYLSRSERFIQSELEAFDYDFVISDFVYEAFHVACKRGVPAFGVAHFTWDWFFSKLFPPPLPRSVLQWFFDCGDAADVIYFPPFTPDEILNHYRHKAKPVPLIVRALRQVDKIQPTAKFKVLIMDSGSSVLAPQIQQALAQIPAMRDCHFFLSSLFSCDADNVTFIEPTEIFSDYMPHMDLVICRAGFNTISECIAYRTPMLLIGRTENPEMRENMLSIKQSEVGTIMSIETFVSRLGQFLPRFIDHEYRNILAAMAGHEIPHNGADIVAEDMLTRLIG